MSIDINSVNRIKISDESRISDTAKKIFKNAAYRMIHHIREGTSSIGNKVFFTDVNEQESYPFYLAKDLKDFKTPSNSKDTFFGTIKLKTNQRRKYVGLSEVLGSDRINSLSNVGIPNEMAASSYIVLAKEYQKFIREEALKEERTDSEELADIMVKLAKDIYPDYVKQVVANVICGTYTIPGAFNEVAVVRLLAKDWDVVETYDPMDLGAVVTQILGLLYPAIDRNCIKAMYVDYRSTEEEGLVEATKAMICQLGDPNHVDAVRVNAEGWKFLNASEEPRISLQKILNKVAAGKDNELTTEEKALRMKYAEKAKEHCQFIEIKDCKASFIRKRLPPVDDDCELVKEDLDVWLHGTGNNDAEMSCLTSVAEGVLKTSKIGHKFSYSFESDDKIELLNNMYNEGMLLEQRENHYADAIAISSMNGGILIVPTGGFTKEIAEEFDLTMCANSQQKGSIIADDTAFNIPYHRADEILNMSLKNDIKSKCNDNLFIINSNIDKEFGDDKPPFVFGFSKSALDKISNGEPVCFDDFSSDIKQYSDILSIAFTYRGSPEADPTMSV